MPRLVSALLVVGLLAGTAAAFAVTERLKLVRSPILGTELDRRVFSPVCDCPTDSVELGFSLRNPDRLTVTILDGAGEPVRTLLRDEQRPAGPVVVRWDGRDAAGAAVPEGTYRPRVHLAAQRWTIDLPNPMRVDTTPPGVTELDVSPLTFSPDGDGRRDKVTVRYALTEPGRAVLHVDGEPRVRQRGLRAEGKLDWHGLRGDRGLPAGEYRLTLVATDRAGNESEPAGPVAVTIRYIEVRPAQVRVRAGARFRVRVVADAESYAWRLRGTSGRGIPGVLVLRAPRQPGRYALVVEANDRRARANVIVEAGSAG